MEEPAWGVVELKQPKVFRLGSLFLRVVFPGLDAGPRLTDFFRSCTALWLHKLSFLWLNHSLLPEDEVVALASQSFSCK